MRDDLRYRIYLGCDDLFVVTCVQWFDLYDYDEKRWLRQGDQIVEFATEAATEAHLRDNVPRERIHRDHRGAEDSLRAELTSARARLAVLHDRSGLDLDGFALACAKVPEQTFGGATGWASALTFVYRTSVDPGEEFWSGVVRASNAAFVVRELAAGGRCRASRDGDCLAPECPQEIEGRRGYLPHCPLDVGEED